MTLLLSKFGLFNRLQAFFLDHAPPTPTTKGIELLTAWEKMLDLSEHIEWDHEDTSILLEGEKRKPLCHARYPGAETTVQTVLLGFDLRSNQILIDEFFPAPKTDFFDREFELIFKGAEGLLILKVKVIEKVYLQSQAAFLVKVISKQRTADRRAHARIHFNNNASPKIELVVPLSGPIQGNLLDLSSEGLTMIVFGPNKTILESKTGECTLYFTDNVKFRSKMRIKQVSHSRSPSSHTTFRVMFYKTTDTQRDQLSAFIQSFQSLRSQAA